MRIDSLSARILALGVVAAAATASTSANAQSAHPADAPAALHVFRLPWMKFNAFNGPTAAGGAPATKQDGVDPA